MNFPVKVSVVVPVYNAEKYLPQCIDSILGQTLKNIEILCVDDGSTDQSLQILQVYAKQDSRLKVIQQQNKYAGAARNRGLDAAVGEYIIFWDSDDYFAETALEKLYTQITKMQADICICDAQDFDNETGAQLSHNYIKKPYPEAEVINATTFQERFFNFTAPVTWNKLIRRELLIREHIRFQEIKHINDVLAIFTALACADRITLVPEKLIYYRTNRAGSLMATYGSKSDSVFIAYRQLNKELQQRGVLDNPVLHRSFRNKIINIVFFMMQYCNNYEQYVYYYDAVKAFFSELDMDALPEDSISSPDDAERYRLLYEGTAASFLFCQFQKLHTAVKAEKDAKLELKRKNRKLKRQLKDAKAAASNAQAALDQCHASRSYRLARAITYIPRHIRAFLQK